MHVPVFITITIAVLTFLVDTPLVAAEGVTSVRSTLAHKHASITRTPLKIDYHMDIVKMIPEKSESLTRNQLVVAGNRFYHEATSLSGNYVNKYSFDGTQHRTYLKYEKGEDGPVEVGTVGNDKGMQPARFPFAESYFFPTEIAIPGNSLKYNEDKTTLSLEWEVDGERGLYCYDSRRGNMPLASEVYVNGTLRTRNVYSNPIEIKPGLFMPGTVEASSFSESGLPSQTLKYHNIKYTIVTPAEVETALKFAIPEAALNNKKMKARIPLARPGNARNTH